jgi:hypothetical protein
MRSKSLFSTFAIPFSTFASLALTAVASDAVVNIQNIGSGARASSLGNAFVAVADNADAVFANPAGLNQLKGAQLAYTNVSLLFTGIDADNLGQHVASYARPLGGKMSLGLGYERIGSDLLSENGAFLSLGLKLSRKLSLGLTAKYVFWSVGDIPNDAETGQADPLSNQSQGAIGADIGLLWKAPIRDARVGLLLKNALQPNVAKGNVKNTDGSDAGDVPMDLHIGVSTSVAEASMVSVQWVMRDLTGEEVDKRLVVGGETKVAEGFMLRAGGSKIFEDEASGDVNAGLGYKWNKTQFDYGYHIPLDLRETNGSHRFSLGYVF